MKYVKLVLYPIFAIYILFLLYEIFITKVSTSLRNQMIYIGVGIAVLLLLIEIFSS